MDGSAFSQKLQQRTLSDVELEKQAEMIKSLFDLWKLNSREQNHLLDHLDEETMGHLFAIHRYLKCAYPDNTDLAYRWMKTPNMDFQDYSPLEVLIRDGSKGLIRIRNYLASNLE